MPRPAGTPNLTATERGRIRALYFAGARLEAIAADVGRSMSTVQRAVRGLRRKKPGAPRGRHAERDDRILELVESGKSRAEVGALVGLSASQVSWVVRRHPKVVAAMKAGQWAEVERRWRVAESRS
jgi:DNA-binding CsgD family transcriptional regulator